MNETHLPKSSPYNQGGYRSLISVLMPQGHRIVWNWDTCRWDDKTIEEYDELKTSVDHR